MGPGLARVVPHVGEIHGAPFTGRAHATAQASEQHPGTSCLDSGNTNLPPFDID